MANKWKNCEEIEIFREFLRIPSVQPNIDYKPCVNFLEVQAKSLGLPINVYYAGHTDKPIVVITWEGAQPELPSIMLNCHMDVVPVDEDKWDHPPFSAHMDDQGRIFARGSQDMKCLGTQYLAVVRDLKRRGKQLKRTLHMTFVPDEEIGGEFGMQSFVHTPEFKKLNVGFAIDEGTPEENDVFGVYYAERTMWRRFLSSVLYILFIFSFFFRYSLSHKRNSRSRFPSPREHSRRESKISYEQVF